MWVPQSMKIVISKKNPGTKHLANLGHYKILNQRNIGIEEGEDTVQKQKIK